MPGPTDKSLTQERLKELVDYDPETGIFTRKAKTWRNVVPGKRAGSVDSNGYLILHLERKAYYGQLLAWLYVYGAWPEHRLSFKNGNTADCRIENIVPLQSLPKKYDHSTPEGRSAYLVAHRARYHDSYKNGWLQRNYGIGLDEYHQRHDDQDGCCAICGKPEVVTRNGVVVKLSVDHNHTTGVVRDLLCRGCNQLIGNAKEDVAVLENAIAYLRRHETAQLPFVPYHPELGMTVN